MIEHFLTINGTLTGTTAPGQSGPKSNEEVPHIPQSSRTEPHHQMQFSVISKTLVDGLLLISEIQSAYSTAYILIRMYVWNIVRKRCLYFSESSDGITLF